MKETATSAVEEGKEFVEEQKSVISTAGGGGKEAYEKEKEKLFGEHKA